MVIFDPSGDVNDDIKMIPLMYLLKRLYRSQFRMQTHHDLLSNKNHILYFIGEEGARSSI
jgi:hypothetical protein